MAKGDKYAPLTHYLAQSGREEVALTFWELEGICGLPPSAYQYPACWVNSSQNSLCHGWLLAGYVMERCAIPAQRVTFRRDPHRAEDYLAREGGGKADAPSRRRRSLGNALPAEAVELAPLLDAGTHFLRDMEADPHARYRSWEHCYQAFSAAGAELDAERADALALHLAWYLASWGMLRGGAFLLQKDYKIHLSAVALLLEPRWTPLRRLSRADLAEGAFAGGVMELAGELTRLYQREAGETPTDTLLTKILLGTLGCTPAYDRYFKWAAKETHATTATFTEGSLRALGRLYAARWEEWEALRRNCSRRLSYPPMKIVDMCLFQYGLERQPQEGAGEADGALT